MPSYGPKGYNNGFTILPQHKGRTHTRGSPPGFRTSRIISVQLNELGGPTPSDGPRVRGNPYYARTVHPRPRWFPTRCSRSRLCVSSISQCCRHELARRTLCLTSNSADPQHEPTSAGLDSFQVITHEGLTVAAGRPPHDLLKLGGRNRHNDWSVAAPRDSRRKGNNTRR